LLSLCGGPRFRGRVAQQSNELRFTTTRGNRERRVSFGHRV
jgi:hypothetical protein